MTTKIIKNSQAKRIHHNLKTGTIFLFKTYIYIYIKLYF